MSRLRSEDGFTLPEVLLAATLMVIVFVATLTTLSGSRNLQTLDQRRVDSQENLRRGIDQLQRQLRNLATPVGTVKPIERAQAMDIVFQTANPSKRWVRYCINPSDPLIASGKASLWYQVSTTASNTPPAATSCPQASGWSTTAAVGESVVNANASLARGVFTYNWPKDADGNDVTTDTAAITRVHTDLWVDVNPGSKPLEQRLSSGVYLRNQNQTPVAAFSSSRSGLSVVLNASATTDYEGRRLSYFWWLGTSVTIPADCRPPEATASDYASLIADYVGAGIVAPVTLASPSTVTLCVIDPGDLTATLTKTV